MHQRRIGAKEVSTNQIDTYIRLANEPIDERLLERYFQVRCGDESAGSLTPIEDRWIVSNLAANESWKVAWRSLERRKGHLVRPADLAVPISIGAQRRHVWTAKWPIAAALAFVALYGVLWMGGRVALPETHRLASLEGYQGLLEQQTRSMGTEAQNSFAEAAKALLAAPHNVLGLFPGYDESHVEDAIDYLGEAFRASPDPFERAEIAFFLAKAHLMNNDGANARDWLQRVLDQEVADYREDSEKLLDALTVDSIR